MTRLRSKAPRKENAAEHGETMSGHVNPTNMRKILLALAVLCELGWIFFLVVLAAMK